MNRMHIFLSTSILLLSQQTFCMFFSLQDLKYAEDQMYHQRYGRYPVSEQDKKKTQKSPKGSIITGQTTPLKGSTDKINDNK